MFMSQCTQQREAPDAEGVATLPLPWLYRRGKHDTGRRTPPPPSLVVTKSRARATTKVFAVLAGFFLTGETNYNPAVPFIFCRKYVPFSMYCCTPWGCFVGSSTLYQNSVFLDTARYGAPQAKSPRKIRCRPYR